MGAMDVIWLLLTLRNNLNVFCLKLRSPDASEVMLLLASDTVFICGNCVRFEGTRVSKFPLKSISTIGVVTGKSEMMLAIVVSFKPLPEHETARVVLLPSVG